MRSVVALSVMLLALTLALNHALALFPQAALRSASDDRPLELVIGAKGPLLPAALIGSGPERIGAAMRIGERTLVPQEGASGLRMASIGPDRRLRAERCFDVARSSAEVRALRERIEQAEWGEVLVLASSGRLEPTGAGAGERRGELAAAVAPLGARAQPGTHTPESWALIALRSESGWVALAESYSQDSGVALSFLLSPASEEYADFRGDHALVRAPKETQVFLEEELGNASRRDAGTELVREGSVAGRTVAGIRQPALLGPDGSALRSSLVWRDVVLGPGSGFLAAVGLADGASAESDGVVFEVRVDGVVLQSAVVLPGEPWKVLQVDLRAFAGRSVELELAVDPRVTGVGDQALWGRPRLVHGYDRSPLEAWTQER